MKLYIEPFTILLLGIIFAATTLAVETNNPEVSNFGDKYLSADIEGK